jgi:hypothetical protein
MKSLNISHMVCIEEKSVLVGYAPLLWASFVCECYYI